MSAKGNAATSLLVYSITSSARASSVGGMVMPSGNRKHPPNHG
jgi:hypothetical protein